VTRKIFENAAISNRLAGRLLEVIDRLCASFAPLLEAEQPEQMLQDPGLFDNVQVQDIFMGDTGALDGIDMQYWNNNAGYPWGVDS
jgi:hypothetical protein